MNGGSRQLPAINSQDFSCVRFSLSQFTLLTQYLLVSLAPFALSLSLSLPFSYHGGRTKAYAGLSFCLTVRDGRSVLWVTESSCVVDACVCVSTGVNMCRNVSACVCVCCAFLQVLCACFVSF